MKVSCGCCVVVCVGFALDSNDHAAYFTIEFKLRLRSNSILLLRKNLSKVVFPVWRLLFESKSNHDFATAREESQEVPCWSWCPALRVHKTDTFGEKSHNFNKLYNF